MEEVQALVRKAEESLDVARVLLDRGNFGFSVSRSYYAMFYLAEALLLTQGLSFSKHSAVIAAFGRVFVKTGLMERKFHAYLRKGFEARQVGDYEPMEEISEETARLTLQRAHEFLEAARNYLERSTPQPRGQ